MGVCVCVFSVYVCVGVNYSVCDHVQERTDLYRLRLHVNSGSGNKERRYVEKKDDDER